MLPVSTKYILNEEQDFAVAFGLRDQSPIMALDFEEVVPLKQDDFLLRKGRGMSSSFWWLDIPHPPVWAPPLSSFSLPDSDSDGRSRIPDLAH